MIIDNFDKEVVWSDLDDEEAVERLAVINVLNINDLDMVVLSLSVDAPSSAHNFLIIIFITILKLILDIKFINQKSNKHLFSDWFLFFLILSSLIRLCNM